MTTNAVAPPAVALFLVSSLLMRSFASPWLLVSWTALALAFALAGKSRGPRPVFYGLCALLAFHALAIPGSLFWGTGNWALTAGVVLWMTPSFALYLVDNLEDVLAWLIPAFLVHAGLVLWQGFTNWGVAGGVMVYAGAPTGLANNRNLAAGFLCLGIVYLLGTRARWLTLPLFMALLFTGSRWGLVVTVALLTAMVLTRYISWRVLAGGVASLAVGVVLIGAVTSSGYQVAGYNSVAGAAYAANEDIGQRLALPHLPSFLPAGVAEYPGLHNVPVRILFESGVVAAAVWFGVTVWCLTRRPLSGPWWLLLALSLLSMLDYYTWMGHLGGFWWLLVGIQTRATPLGLVARRPEAEFQPS